MGSNEIIIDITKDFLLGVHSNVTTINLQIYVNVVVWQTMLKNSIYFPSFNQSDHCFLALSLSVAVVF